MEGKGAFAKVVQKTLNRTKAKVLQNLGKADRTTDERFEEHVANFTRQQAMAARLHKEVKHYVNCIKAMTAASKSLYTVIKETYEPEWVDVHSVDSAIRSIDMLYSNYEAELLERVSSDLHTYVEQFNPMKEKINKRRRKLLDYDDAKHSYDSACNAKKPDDIKIARASGSLHEAEQLYNDLNTELNRELPKFYKYRIDFLASNLSRLYSTEATFHLETGKITDQLHDLMEKIPKAGTRPETNDYNCNMADQSGLDLSNMDKSVTNPKTEHEKWESEAKSDNEYSDVEEEVGVPPKHERSDDSYVTMDNRAPGSTATSAATSGDGLVSPNNTVHTESAVASNPPAHCDTVHKTPSDSSQNTGQGRRDGETILLAEAVVTDYDVPPSPAQAVVHAEDNDDSVYQNVETADMDTESTSGKVISAGQQVLATHNYQAEDEDELSLEAGEIIEVIEFEDPDDEDDGWLMGRSKRSGRKGVFPVNFTRRVVQRNSKS